MSFFHAWAFNFSLANFQFSRRIKKNGPITVRLVITFVIRPCGVIVVFIKARRREKFIAFKIIRFKEQQE